MSTTDLLVQISPDVKLKTPSILPIQIVTENEGSETEHTVSVNVQPGRRSPSPSMPKAITLPASPHMDMPSVEPAVLRRSGSRDSLKVADSPLRESSRHGGSPKSPRVDVPSIHSQYKQGSSPSVHRDTPMPSPFAHHKPRRAESLRMSEESSSDERVAAKSSPSSSKMNSPMSSSKKGSPLSTPKKSAPAPRELYKAVSSAAKKKSTEVTAVAAARASAAKKSAAIAEKAKATAPTMNSVQSFLSKHPEFAEEFSYTIPVSPTSMDASPFSSPAPSDSEKKKKSKSKSSSPRKPVVVQKEESDEEDEEPMEPKIHDEPSEDEEEEDEPSEEEEEVPKRKHKIIKHVEDEEPEAEDDSDDQAQDDVEPEKWSDDVSDHETDVFGAQPQVDVETEGSDSKKKPVKDDKKKKAAEPKPQTEEEEALEKMELIEDIKEGARIGFMPSQPPTFDMPIKILRQIKQFQDEKAAEAIHIGYMGVGLVSLVNLVQTVNGKFDPFEKVFGHGLMMQGSKEAVEQNLPLYKVPFTKIYRRLRKGGMGGELPPWAQVILITSGIIGEVHKVNVLQKMEADARKEEEDPESLRRAREMMMREQQMRQARAHSMRDAVPYHVEMEQQSTPLTDAQMEAVLEKEFSGFDKLPSLDSLRTNGPVPVVVASGSTGTVGPVGPANKTPAPYVPRDVAAARASTSAVQAQAKPDTTVENADSEPVNLVHDVPEPKSDDINLTHSADPEDDEAEEDGEGIFDEDEDEEETETTAPVIQIPSISFKKKN